MRQRWKKAVCTNGRQVLNETAELQTTSLLPAFVLLTRVNRVRRGVNADVEKIFYFFFDIHTFYLFFIVVVVVVC